jgi:hypothetical protein
MNAILRAASVLALAVPLAGCTTYLQTPTSSTETSTTPPGLSTFTSLVAHGGFASRSFTMTTAGTIQATLTAVTPPVPIGLGIGIPHSDGGGCNVSQSVETAAGEWPQISVAAAAGSYCVKVFDMGHIEDAVSFTVTVTHP